MPTNSAEHIHSDVEVDCLACDECDRPAHFVCETCGYSVCSKCRNKEKTVNAA